MSYIFLLEQGAVSSAECFSDIPVSVLSRLNLIAGKSCCNDSEMESCRGSRSGMTCERSMADHGEELSMSCAVDSRARTYPRQIAKDGASMGSAVDYGERWPESLAKYDRDTSSWKTRQRSFFGEWEEFSETWPKWGMMRNGELLERSTPDFSTNVIAYGFLPTIVKSDIKAAKLKLSSVHKILKRGRDKIQHLRIAYLWKAMGLPSWTWPLIAEVMMGWPTQWTDLRPLAMDRFRRWLDSHGIR